MSNPDSDDIITYKSLRLDYPNCILYRGEDEIHLEPLYADMMRVFMQQPGVFFHPDELWPVVSKYVEETEDETRIQIVRNYIHCLRQRIEPDPINCYYIHTVIRYGYCFEEGRDALYPY